MEVSLTAESERLIHEKLDRGQHASASEVILEALRLMSARDQVLAMNAADFQQKIACGMSSLRAGDCVDGEDYMDRMDKELAALPPR